MLRKETVRIRADRKNRCRERRQDRDLCALAKNPNYSTAVVSDVGNAGIGVSGLGGSSLGRGRGLEPPVFRPQDGALIWFECFQSHSVGAVGGLA